MSREPTDSDAVLAEQMRALRRFRSALDHELRSGLNSIALNTELLAVQINRLEGEDEVAGLSETLAGLREGVEGLTRRIEAVLQIATPTDGAGDAELDLAGLLRSIAVPVTFEARLLRVRCETDLPKAPVLVEARRSAMQTALLWLAAKALRLAVPGGALRWSLEVEPDHVDVKLDLEPFQELAGEAEADDLALAPIFRPLGAAFESTTLGEILRLRLRFPARAARG